MTKFDLLIGKLKNHITQQRMVEVDNLGKFIEIKKRHVEIDKLTIKRGVKTKSMWVSSQANRIKLEGVDFILFDRARRSRDILLNLNTM